MSPGGQCHFGPGRSMSPLAGEANVGEANVKARKINNFNSIQGLLSPVQQFAVDCLVMEGDTKKFA